MDAIRRLRKPLSRAALGLAAVLTAVAASAQESVTLRVNVPDPLALRIDSEGTTTTTFFPPNAPTGFTIKSEDRVVRSWTLKPTEQGLSGMLRIDESQMKSSMEAIPMPDLKGFQIDYVQDSLAKLSKFEAVADPKADSMANMVRGLMSAGTYLALLAVEYPEGPVKKGDTWDRNIGGFGTTPQGGQEGANFKLTTKLVDFVEESGVRYAKLEVRGDGKVAGAGGQQLDFRTLATQWVELKSGLPVYVDFISRAETAMGPASLAIESSSKWSVSQPK